MIQPTVTLRENVQIIDGSNALPIRWDRSLLTSFRGDMADILLRCVSVIVLLSSFILYPRAALADSSGSGFFINSFWVMTNDHVVDGCSRVEVEGFGEVEDVLRDPDSDLAVIRLEQPFRGQVLPFRTRNPRLAENLHVLGYPLSDVLSASVRVTSGSVSALNAFELDDGLIQISAPIQPGNSGGPVIDDDGSVVGVAVGILNRSSAQNVNFAISGATSRDFLDRRAIAYSLSSERAAIPESLPDVIERAAEATVQVKCFGATRTPPAGSAAQQDDGLVISRGRDVIGYDYQFLRNTSLSACRNTCEGDLRCRSFTFNTRHSACFLKDGGTLLVTNADAISGYARDLAIDITDTGFVVKADTDAPGGDYKRIRQSNYISCLAECGLDWQCRAFAYVRESRDCWLKDRVGTILRMPGVEFGFK